MIEFLSVQVRLGNIILDEIPEKYKKEVQEILDREQEHTVS